MKLNNKGFVAAGVLYALLVLFLALIISLLTLLSNRKMILDKVKSDIKDELNMVKKYKLYDNGTIVYFNPNTGELCGDYVEENSKNENKEGCMKWYAFNDGINNSTLNLILDHNTTKTVLWNSSNKISDGMGEVADKLKSDTYDWIGVPEVNKTIDNFEYKGLRARLITASEIKKITGNETFDPQKSPGGYYFDTNSSTKNSDINEKGKSLYGWLFDNTKSCERNGCNSQYSDVSGYWTSSPAGYSTSKAWHTTFLGNLSDYDIGNYLSYGVRPVITVNKKDLETKVQKETNYKYTGSEQVFNVPVSGKYKLEVWGAEGGKASSDYIGGYGGYSVGSLHLTSNTKLYINVGGQGYKYSDTTLSPGGYNGGGNGGIIDAFKTAQGGSGGGGASHIALKSGLLSSLEKYRSDILIVAGAGGGIGSGNHYGGSGGGYIGNDGVYHTGYPEYHATGATQTEGGYDYTSRDALTDDIRGSFGKGHDLVEAGYGGNGGGAGYFGGGGSNRSHSGGGGGSGFIGNSLLNNKIMYCYKCAESNDTNTKTVSTTNLSESPVANYAKIGNGYARITYLGK